MKSEHEKFVEGAIRSVKDQTEKVPTKEHLSQQEAISAILNNEKFLKAILAKSHTGQSSIEFLLAEGPVNDIEGNPNEKLILEVGFSIDGDEYRHYHFMLIGFMSIDKYFREDDSILLPPESKAEVEQWFAAHFDKFGWGIAKVRKSEYADVWTGILRRGYDLEDDGLAQAHGKLLGQVLNKLGELAGYKRRQKSN